MLTDLINSCTLGEPYVIFRGDSNINLDNFKVGEKNKFLGFTATSLSEEKAQEFADVWFEGKPPKNPYVIEIETKADTHGVAIDGLKIGTSGNQQEILLNHEQEYETIEIDKKNRKIKIRLL